jgi:hypothetical protein
MVLAHPQLSMLIKLTRRQVEQYQLCQKRLVDLARSLQDYGITVDPSERDQGVRLPDLRVDTYRPDLSRTYDPRTYCPPPTSQAVPTTPTKKRKKASAPDGDEVGSGTGKGKRGRKSKKGDSG